MRAFQVRLQGKKTYLCAVISVLVGGLHSAGYISDGTFTLLVSLLAPFGLMALRAGVTKSRD